MSKKLTHKEVVAMSEEDLADIEAEEAIAKAEHDCEAYLDMMEDLPDV